MSKTQSSYFRNESCVLYHFFIWCIINVTHIILITHSPQSDIFKQIFLIRLLFFIGHMMRFAFFLLFIRKAFKKTRVIFGKGTIRREEMRISFFQWPKKSNQIHRVIIYIFRMKDMQCRHLHAICNTTRFWSLSHMSNWS